MDRIDFVLYMHRIYLEGKNVSVLFKAKKIKTSKCGH